MRVVELFVSRQGEGLWTGEESVFVRTGGCHLHCRFCDTPYAAWEADEGCDMSVGEIVGRVQASGKRHVVLTGGEPMLHAELVPLTEQLERLGFLITIETSGTLDLPVRCHLMSVSPKLSNSTPLPESGEQVIRRHENARTRIDITRRLLERYDHQLKFVVDMPADLPEIEQFLQQFPILDKKRILLMPQGGTEEEMRPKEEWLRPYTETQGYVYCPRMQILWYGNRRGT